MFMKVSGVIEKYYLDNAWLLLLASIYGLKMIKNRGCTMSQADPGLYFKWIEEGILIWLSWIDDYVYCGKPEDVAE